MKKTEYRELLTEAGERLINAPGGVPWDVYPRPRLVRKDWLCLNGEWEFYTESAPDPVPIRVPFCAESLLSGLDGARRGALRYGEKLYYTRRFSVPEGWKGRRVLLHLTASRESDVYVNGPRFGGGDQAYFSVVRDITSALREGENELRIVCVNDLDPAYPCGKQKIRRGGMWYTPCSGIWQTVWLEPVPEKHITGIDCVQNGNEMLIRVSGAENGEVVCEGKRYPLAGGECRIAFDAPRLWSPEEPNLYCFTVRCGEDESKR